MSAAGVSAGRPSRTSVPTISSRRSQPMSTTMVPPRPASLSQAMASSSLPGASEPVTTVKLDA